MVDRKLREALLQKLGVTPQALSQRAKKLKSKCPMTTEDAVYVIAQSEGMILDKYLDAPSVDRVRALMQHTAGRDGEARRRGGLSKRDGKKADARTLVIAKEFQSTDPVLPNSKLAEAKDMAAVYPLLYVLENSIREVIDRVMTAKHGDRWWDSQAPQGLRDTVKQRMAEEEKHRWHQRRGARPIDYLDLHQLPALVRKIGTNIAPKIIPSIEWFSSLVEEVYKSRCVLCHMNPLDHDSVTSVKLRLKQWQRQVKGMNP